uniref:BZIP domain-containing protein n=1 Tax=Aegilops tauschii TaxID=37682 RepID=M8B1L4_AEGTA
MQMQDDSAPRKAHRRSRSDVPFGYFPPPSPKTESGWGLPCAGGGGGGGGDELFNAFMSMEGMDGLNSSDGDSRGSSMPPANGADSSENESEDYGGGESQVFLWGEAGKKRNAAGEPAAAAARHARSLSMDSLMGKLSFSANGGSRARCSPTGRHKVQILQTEATTLSAQLTHLQRDSSGLATHNNELKFRLQAMEQQAQLRDALNEALTGEVQRLKQSATSERGGDAGSSSNLAQQMQLRCQNQMLEMHKQQQQIPFYQLEQPEQNGESN